MVSKIFAFTLLAIVFTASVSYSQSIKSQAKIYPDTTWYKYTSTEKAGWPSEKIVEIKAFADSVGSDAVMLIYNGAVVAAWGYYAEIEYIASINKTLISSLYGIAVDKGVIDTSVTVGELDITGQPPFSETEKQASVFDLLSMGSGIDQNPKDGRDLSAKSGKQWFYNSWNYAALGSIYRKQTGMNIFKAFEKFIAEPIGMEDYESNWGNFFGQPWRSNHLGHNIWMSARDLARFGLLYLRNGQWKGEQIIPATWVRASQKPIFKNVYGENLPLSYGLGWWLRGGKFAEYGTYFASGVGNQSIWILPKLDIVFVHRSTRDYNQGVNGLLVEEMLLRLIKAQTLKPAENPELVPLKTKAQLNEQ